MIKLGQLFLLALLFPLAMQAEQEALSQRNTLPIKFQSVDRQVQPRTPSDLNLEQAAHEEQQADTIKKIAQRKVQRFQSQQAMDRDATTLKGAVTYTESASQEPKTQHRCCPECTCVDCHCGEQGHRCCGNCPCSAGDCCKQSCHDCCCEEDCSDCLEGRCCYYNPEHIRWHYWPHFPPARWYYITHHTHHYIKNLRGCGRH